MKMHKEKTILVAALLSGFVLSIFGVVLFPIHTIGLFKEGRVFLINRAFYLSQLDIAEAAGLPPGQQRREFLLSRHLYRVIKAQEIIKYDVRVTDDPKVESIKHQLDLMVASALQHGITNSYSPVVDTRVLF